MHAEEITVEVLNKNLRAFAKRALRDLDGNVFPLDKLTVADAILIIVTLCGVKPSKPDYVNRTILLGLVDEKTDLLIYRTIPMIDFHDTPFTLHFTDKNTGTLEYREGVERRQWPVVFGTNFFRPLDHHFNQLDREGNLLPVSIIANPRSVCEEKCVGCSRTALPFFYEQGADYVAEHVAQVVGDFAEKFPGLEKQELKFVSLVTGCQPTSEKEFEMFVNILQAYQEAGFAANFIIFSNRIRRRVDMQRLFNLGVIGYVSSLEVFNDVRRRDLWGETKGLKSLASHLDNLDLAREFFTIVEASLVLGQDSFDDAKQGIRILGTHRVTMIPNVLRAYNLEQLRGIHSDVWASGLVYFIKTFEMILANNEKLYSSAAHLRVIAKKYLEQVRGREISDRDLPIKYRG